MRGLLWVAGLGAVLTACETDPDRPDPAEFPSARDDTFTPPVPNTCETLTNTFAITAEGYFNGTFEGIAGYEYRSSEDVTSVYLTVCPDGASEQIFAMHRFGGDRATPGTYLLDMFPIDDDNFNFSFVDGDPDRRVSCMDRPNGQIVLEEADVGRMKGSLDVTVRCTSEDLIWRIPQEVRFTGTFDAVNIGRE